MAEPDDGVTVYFDGSGTRYRAQIGRHRTIDEGNRLCFVEGSTDAPILAQDLNRQGALARSQSAVREAPSPAARVLRTSPGRLHDVKYCERRWFKRHALANVCPDALRD